MRQNKICYKWQCKEIQNFFFVVRPYKKGPSMILYCNSTRIHFHSWKEGHVPCHSNETLCFLSYFHLLLLASPLDSERESNLISYSELQQSWTAWRIALQKTDSGEDFFFRFSSPKHFCRRFQKKILYTYYAYYTTEIW